MTFTSVPRDPEIAAVIAALTDAGLVVGDGARPTGAGYPDDDTTKPYTPYVVVFPGITTETDGPVSDPFADITAEVAIHAVGVTRKQATVTADRARAALLTQALAIPGRHLQIIAPTGAGRPVERDDDVTPPLFLAVDMYEISTAPAD